MSTYGQKGSIPLSFYIPHRVVLEKAVSVQVGNGGTSKCNGASLVNKYFNGVKPKEKHYAG